MTLPGPLLPNAAARPALRTLAVLLLLLGVLAMHQLSGGDHMSMSVGASTSALHMRSPPTAPDAMPSTGRAAATHTPAARTTHDRPGVPAEKVAAGLAAGVPAGHDVMPMCLAVLTGLFALVVPAPTRAGAAAPAGLRVVSSQTRPAGRGPPRDLLAQLCVFRT